MSKYRRAAKRDESEPGIVKELRENGWLVERELPIDLLCFKWVTLEQFKRAITVREDGMIRLIVPLECKTARGKKDPKARLRPDQEEQNKFCEDWKIDKPTTPNEAMLFVGEVWDLDP